MLRKAPRGTTMGDDHHFAIRRSEVAVSFGRQRVLTYAALSVALSLCLDSTTTFYFETTVAKPDICTDGSGAGSPDRMENPFLVIIHAFGKRAEDREVRLGTALRCETTLELVNVNFCDDFDLSKVTGVMQQLPVDNKRIEMLWKPLHGGLYLGVPDRR